LAEGVVVRLGIVIERRYMGQIQPAGLKGALEARGHHVRLINADEALFHAGNARWVEGLDGVVARGRSWHLLALLGSAERLGMPTINRRHSIARVLNKLEMSSELAHAGVPIPATFGGTVCALARSVPARAFPLVIKPLFGDNSRGVRIVHTCQELSAIEWPEEVAIAQQYIASDGFDLKIYGIGDHVFVGRRQSPLSLGDRREQQRTRLVGTTPELEKLGRACMDLFGLELYGVDCIQTDEGPVVIEVNDFPNYSGVPNSNDLLAYYVVSRIGSWGRP
jgi:ribosomal protein S6--L-glutamate ligase